MHTRSKNLRFTNSQIDSAVLTKYPKMARINTSITDIIEDAVMFMKHYKNYTDDDELMYVITKRSLEIDDEYDGYDYCFKNNSTLDDVLGEFRNDLEYHLDLIHRRPELDECYMYIVLNDEEIYCIR